MKRSRILVVDDLEYKSICTRLEGKGYDVQGVGSGREALERLKGNEFDLVITDLELKTDVAWKMPGIEGTKVMRMVKSISPQTRVIVITAYSGLQVAVEEMRLGAFDYIIKGPEFPEALLDSVGRALGLLPTPSESSEIIGKSALIEKAKELAVMAARSDIRVLLLGERGTGKELIARLIHKESPRSGKKFVATNSAALSEGLALSELFGHVKGCFNGALDKKGLFEVAKEGSLFLDEIGAMPPVIQPALLRVLQEGKFFPVGGTEEIEVDVRIIAATNADLDKLMMEGGFREDLYDRLNEFSIRLPPLRDRSEDIPLLVDAFIQKYKKTKSDLDLSEQISQKALDLLMAYAWPGNVRELENQIRRALILSGDDMITEDHLELRNPPSPLTLKERERKEIEQTLKKNGGNKKKTAEELGTTRPTLDKKIKEYHIEPEEYL